MAAAAVVEAVERWRIWTAEGFGRRPVSPSPATNGPTLKLAYADLSLGSVLDDVEKPACLVRRRMGGGDAAGWWLADCLAVTRMTVGGSKEKASSALSLNDEDGVLCFLEGDRDT